jgi:hypothetical protein
MKRRTKSANFAPWPLPIAGLPVLCFQWLDGFAPAFWFCGVDHHGHMAGSVGCLSSDILVIPIE